MKEINASPVKLMSIGYEGEDKVTKIVFQYDESWLSYGDGEFKVRVLRPGDKEAYNATDVVDNRSLMTLIMTVTDIELSRKGRGELQLVYVCAGAIKKSQIYRYNVSRAIDSEVVNPPEGSIIAEVEESLAEIKDGIGDLSDLTTTDKSNLVGAINEVNAKEVEVTVDSGLSATSTNPLQNKVITGAFMDALETLSGKADKSYVDTELASKADSSDVQTALSAKANTADVNSALALKANTDVATQSANGLMSSADKTKLDGLGNSGVSDVQVNGTSVVSNGVAEIPIAGVDQLGLVKKSQSRTRWHRHQ